MGEIHTDTRIRVHGGGQLSGGVRLPELEDVSPRPEPLLDRLGRIVGERPLLLGTTTLLAGAAAASLGGGGVVARALRGIGGAAAGLAGGFALAGLAGKVAGTSDPTTNLYVASDAAPVVPKPGAKPEHLRVLDWNVHALMGVSDGGRPDEEALGHIAEVVRRERPDVLVLQEVQYDRPMLGGDVDDLALLAERLGATDAVLVPNGTRPNGTQKGQAILTFGETRVQDARGLAHADPNGDGVLRELAGAVGWARSAGFTLPDFGPSFHPRTTTDAMITTPAGRAVRLLDVHLSGTGGPATGGSPGSTQSQEDQLVPIAETLDAWEGATILAGDFNVRSGTPWGDFEAKVLGDKGLRDAFTQVGIGTDDDAARGSYQGTSRSRGAPIDRIYTSDEVKVLDVEVLRDDVARSASDHLAVLADVEVS